MMKDTFQKRFTELAEAYKALIVIKKTDRQTGADRSYFEAGTWQKWATSAQSLIKASFGETSPHYVNFVTAYDKCIGYVTQVNKMCGIFMSAKEDFEGGYVFNVDLQVSGEVFGDFVKLAKQTLAEGHKDVAAVLACAALEDALKRYAAVNDIDDLDTKTMTDIVNALKSKGLVTGASKTLLDTMPKIRDYAMHANWEKISDSDVNSVIGYVEQFLLSNFS